MKLPLLNRRSLTRAGIDSLDTRKPASIALQRAQSFSHSTKQQPFNALKVPVAGTDFSMYSLTGLKDDRLQGLPYSIRILLESAIRNCDGVRISENDVETILDWKNASKKEKEIPFMPGRVLLQDFTGVPAVVDLAAMRDIVQQLGSDPMKINPLVPVDLVIDHSVQVDYSRSSDAFSLNLNKEMQRNSERFAFLKWGSRAFKNMRIVPPGSGIVHQVNLEFLARVVMQQNGILYPDSVVGTDSHTTMINGLGVLGWGVGGIEAEAVMLGQHISMVLPQVVGVRLIGELPSEATATDLVLTCTQMLRKLGVVGKFVEFFGPGLSTLSLADRATVANMAPEYGATIGYFPLDHRSLAYMEQTGRARSQIDLVEKYARDNLLYADESGSANVHYSQVLDVDLSTIKACIAGPKRPQDRVPLTEVKSDFQTALSAPVGFKGYSIPQDQLNAEAKVTMSNGETHTLKHGSVVIAAITSCTNTSNPGVIFAAALLARNAVKRGLSVPPYVVTSLSPGSKVVTEYLQKSGLQKDLETLGFYLAGYGCMTCIGNTGEFEPQISKAITDNKLAVAAVLSGNRNFEGRTHPLTRCNYLASPPLVVAYALAGKVDIDFASEPIGTDSNGSPVYLSEIWPSRENVQSIEKSCLTPDMFSSVYKSVTEGTSAWKELKTGDSLECYTWDEQSTYIHKPPFFQNMQRQPEPIGDIQSAHCLLKLGDSITTDHISPAGNIAKTSPAAKFLESKGISRPDFNTYGARRGNDEVMERGTFANIRLNNDMCPNQGPQALHIPTNETLSVYDAAKKYKDSNTPVIILAGREYGSGSSRDWAAKGPYLMGVKAIIAESFERIHRSNLVGMGILPLQYLEGQSAQSLGLTGMERFSIPTKQGDLQPGETIDITTDCGKTFSVRCRIDTPLEVQYYKHGGILRYVLRSIIE